MADCGCGLRVCLPKARSRQRLRAVCFLVWLRDNAGDWGATLPCRMTSKLQVSGTSMNIPERRSREQEFPLSHGEGESQPEEEENPKIPPLQTQISIWMSG